MTREKEANMICPKCGEIYSSLDIERHYNECKEVISPSQIPQTAEECEKPEGINQDDWNSLTDYQKLGISVYNPIKDVKSSVLLKEGKAIYIWNRKTLNMTIKDIPRTTPLIDLPSTGERFALRESVGTLDGLPAWFLERGNPISLSFEVLQNSINEGYPSSFDIEAQHKGLHLQRLARTNVMDMRLKILWFFTVFTSVICTVLFYTVYINAIYGGK